MGVKFERNLSRKANRVIEEALSAFEPEIVHVDEPDRIFLGTLNAPGVDYAKAAGVPCVGFYHTNFIDYIEDFLPLPKPLISVVQWFSMLFIRPVFHSYDVILTASEVTQERLRQLGVVNTRCDRYLGVDLDAFDAAVRSPHYFQTHYGIEGIDNRIKLTFLGRLTPDKGWKFTLRALSTWVQNPENADWIERVALIIAGDGELREEIESGLKDLGLQAYFLGRISSETVPALLKNSDIHVTTSEKETLGLTVLEAFAAGIPVTAPAAGGVMTSIVDGENGLLFEPQNEVDFGRSLTTLVSSEPRRRTMGRAGRLSISGYDWETAVDKLLNTWKTQIAQKSVLRGKK